MGWKRTKGKKAGATLGPDLSYIYGYINEADENDAEGSGNTILVRCSCLRPCCSYAHRHSWSKRVLQLPCPQSCMARTQEHLNDHRKWAHPRMLLTWSCAGCCRWGVQVCGQGVPQAPGCQAGDSQAQATEERSWRASQHSCTSASMTAQLSDMLANMSNHTFVPMSRRQAG